MNRTIRRLTGLFAAVCLLACTLPTANASGSCTGLGAAAPYNVLVFGDFSAQSSDVEGRLAAGGHVSINHYSLADKLDAATAGTSVVVGGNFSFPSGRIYFGNTVVGGSAAAVGAPVRNGLTPDQRIDDHSALPLDFASEKLRSQALSAALAELPANGTYASQWGGLTFDGSAAASLQVFDLPDQLVRDAHTFNVRNIPAGETVLFNLRGGNAGLTNMSLESLASVRRRVLFNFPDATALTLAGIGVEGSILAPNAVINNPQGVIKGQLIAQSWNGMMQLNHEPFEGCLTGASGNATPQIVSVPNRFATLGRTYRYQVEAIDPDDEPLTYASPMAPPSSTINAENGLFSWAPSASDLGLHPIRVLVSDPAGATATQNYDLRVVQGFCPIYPISLPSSVMDGKQPGDQIVQMPRGTGPGNFSWLSWNGSNNAPTLAASLQPPGNSYNYRNPDNSADQVLNIADWAQGAPGSMNAAAVRAAMDVLKTHDITSFRFGAAAAAARAAISTMGFSAS